MSRNQSVIIEQSAEHPVLVRYRNPARPVTPIRKTPTSRHLAANTGDFTSPSNTILKPTRAKSPMSFLRQRLRRARRFPFAISRSQQLTEVSLAAIGQPGVVSVVECVADPTGRGAIEGQRRPSPFPTLRGWIVPLLPVGLVCTVIGRQIDRSTSEHPPPLESPIPPGMLDFVSLHRSFRVVRFLTLPVSLATNVYGKAPHERIEAHQYCGGKG